MLKNKLKTLLACLILNASLTTAQTLSLDDILIKIRSDNPQLKMYDAEIRSMDEAVKGSKSWMPPQLSTGFFMTPYDTEMWKADELNPGMGNYMLGIEQMIPNPSRQKANQNLMQAMSSVEKENKNFSVNQLIAGAKTNYYQLLVLEEKQKVAAENLLLLSYMIKSMEIRYAYNMDKLPAYYKTVSQYGSLESMLVMIENGISQKKIALNSLMARDISTSFEIDSTYLIRDFNLVQTDTAMLAQSRSDLRAINKTMEINELRIEAERSNLLPEFGLKYDHMFAFGELPQQFNLMMMVKLPFAPWASKMNKSNQHSYKIKNESLQFQKQMILNETSGMLYAMQTEFKNLNRQYEIANRNIIPALKKNYDTALLAWQNNTGDLSAVQEAWEALNMAQLDALDKLEAILVTQVEIERQLEIY